MKDPAAVSPFSLKTSQEQKEQWIWWHCQRGSLLPVQEEEQISPVPEKTPEPEEKPVTPPVRMKTYHSQYDAVIRRMKQATSQAQIYTSVSD